MIETQIIFLRSVNMTTTIEQFEYQFSDIVFVATRPFNRYRTTWYVKCDCEQKRHMFRKLGPKIWVARCDTHGIEWTVTPRELYTCRAMDLTKVMGEI
jgi:hypothetical protein